MITTKSITCVRGQTLPLLFTVRDYKGALVDLTGAACYLTVRTDEKNTGSVIALTVGSGIVLADQSAEQKGQFTATISPANTLTLEIGDYVWDAWIVDVTGNKYPVVATSRFTIIHQVTTPA